MSQEHQSDIKNKGETIFKLMEQQSSQSIFDKDWWYGRIMEWSMKNAQFKTQMFRFVDVLPYLKSGSEVARHLKEYFAEQGEDLPSVFSFGMGLGSLAPGLLAGTVRKNVTQMAKMFIAGENPSEAIAVIRKTRKMNLAFTADLLGEAALSERESIEYQSRYLELINGLVKDSENWGDQPQIDSDDRGPLPKVNVSIKLSALYSQITVKAWDESKFILKERLRPIMQIAKERNVFINLDMEQYSLKDLTLEVFKELVMEPEFRAYPHYGIVIQAYLRDAVKDVEMLIQFARDRGTPFTVRLVKGAYWDYETVQAAQRGWPVPVFTDKAESDVSFEQCAQLLLSNYQVIRTALGSHNVRSISAAMVFAEKNRIPQKAFEIQMLYGMAEPIKKAVIQMGYRVREYMPIGELIPGMAYLVRRLLENTSNESFLRSKFAENASTEKLLADPQFLTQTKTQGYSNGSRATATQTNSSFRDTLHVATQSPLKFHFDNEPLLDFGYPDVRTKSAEALKKVQKRLGETYPLFIGKKEIRTGRELTSINPSHPNQVVGRVQLASAVEAQLAIESARSAYETWKKTSIETRAQLLDRIADKMTEMKYELAAMQVLEVGKPVAEADGDVAEAIDFCRYYAQDMRRIGFPKRVGHAPGEVSLYHYQSRGVVLVIAPWNFPLAILTGMVAAAVVTGNTVIMKPAEQSSIISAGLMEILRAVDCPPGVVNFLPGLGEEVGAYLVAHKDVDMIAFTGSKQVGLHILKVAGDTQLGQRGVKKCVIEMGGKNAIIIDSDADLDEAVAGVLYSAFGFAGQKCSACSRVIVHAEIYDRFVDRFTEAVRSMHVGFAEAPSTFMGPVIDEEAQQRILKVIEDAKSYAKLHYQGEVPSEGYFVPPTLFVDVDYKSPLAQEEIFGPVLAVIRAKDMDEALMMANATAYGLTGGLYSRSPSTIERVKNGFDVGNLYINRQITGALVDRHPFGGFKMSGVGSKTGGPDYLMQFLEPRCVTENTLRRGFAPQEDEQPGE